MRLVTMLSLSLLVLSGSGCGGDSSTATNADDCEELQTQRFDELRRCVSSPSTPTGLRACYDAQNPPGKGAFSVCLANIDGGIFTSWVNSAARIEGAGWTHSTTARFPSTLSSEMESRCAQALLYASVTCP
jgi:hypothetical protein